MTEVPASRLAAILIALIVLAACAHSPPVNYYILRSMQRPIQQERAPGPGPRTAVAVGPVEVPDYLDRPQMVTRPTPDTLKFAEFDRWAEPLDKNLARVLADNLSVLLPAEHVLIFPWRRSMPVKYQITLDVIHFEQMPDKKVLLDASWNILGNDGRKLLVMRRSKVSEPVESAGFEGIASAGSRAVEALSRKIAAAVESLDREAAQ